MCSTIRRLYFQSKLTEDEVSLLENLGFSFLSFDNIYFETNFDDMIQRLIRYEDEYKNNYQVPKKFPFDVQLGAWVTNLRRLGPNSTDILPGHRKVLNQIKFSWTSERKCGSSFMTNLRQVRAALDNCTGVSGDVMDVNHCLSPDLRRWLVAQREARAKGNLNNMRVNYIEELCQDFRIDLSNVEK
jgi:predicted HAD superfamily phosphohydrolase